LLLVFHGADCAEDVVDDFHGLLEEGHEVGHAFGYGPLVALLVAVEQLSDPLLDELQVLVAFEVGRQNP